jgi:hypothetical protein
MECEPQIKLSSIREEEQKYESEIRETYKGNPELFITHSSDALHLEIREKAEGDKKYQTVFAKGGYEKYDTIAEVRGSVIGYDKLMGLLEKGIVKRDSLPLLLYLNSDHKYLLSPKNITRFLFNHPLHRQHIGNYQPPWAQQANC